VKDEAVGETERVLGRDAVDEDGVRGDQARESLAVRGRDAEQRSRHGSEIGNTWAALRVS
jgi:hypothetical protein